MDVLVMVKIEWDIVPALGQRAASHAAMDLIVGRCWLQIYTEQCVLA